ncbi:sugar phosphate nucleotidyltransferase [Geminocystis sp. NIES-3709]|uniref:sugar phosphate nucleotidyltransferase n=1 Tax=Geminocystis sp. NIES-3709 TaxID=1617448 RepID=UPI0005FC82E8|nr:sugar phosphate nucleotidyltransferase [Geminocystis sp. NIES-3709]BAQ63330.1 D-glycero-D-manno-heptose 1-phosphate guanosyltransferase [Geminocystis sp. NIES-3709]
MINYQIKNSIAVILAGGFGTRVKHLLPNIPKPMATVANKPFIEWVIKYLRQQSINNFILSTGYLGEIIESYFNKNNIDNIIINCYQENQPLGTAGGFINAVNLSNKQPFSWLITNGDSLIFTDLKPLFNYLENDDVEGVILGLSLSDASRYGSLKYDRDYNLISFAEKQQGKSVINAGVYLFKHSTLNKFSTQKPLSFEYDVFPQLLNQGCKIKVHITEAPFLDIGTPETLAQAENFILDNRTIFNEELEITN